KRDKNPSVSAANTAFTFANGTGSSQLLPEQHTFSRINPEHQFAGVVTQHLIEAIPGPFKKCFISQNISTFLKIKNNDKNKTHPKNNTETTFTLTQPSFRVSTKKFLQNKQNHHHQSRDEIYFLNNPFAIRTNMFMTKDT